MGRPPARPRTDDPHPAVRRPIPDDFKPKLRAWGRAYHIPKMEFRKGDRNTAMAEPHRVWISKVEAVLEREKTRRLVPVETERITTGGADQ